MAVMLFLSALLGGLVAVALFAGLRPGPVEAGPGAAVVADLQSSFVAVAEQARPAVVNINTEQEIRERRWGFDFDRFWFDPWSDPFRPYTRVRKVTNLGSGFIVSGDGFILTNNHVIAGADRISVTLSDETTLPARLIGFDVGHDLAIIKVDPERPNLPVVRLGDADAVKVGSWAIAIGSPFGFTESVTVGVISAKGRVVRQDGGRQAMRDLLQTDAAINFGNSGGPLVNIDGEVIGINQAIYSPSGTGNIGIGFAIPVNAETKAAIEEAIKSQRRRV
jgi:serine protease Do